MTGTAPAQPHTLRAAARLTGQPPHDRLQPQIKSGEQYILTLAAQPGRQHSGRSPRHHHRPGERNIQRLLTQPARTRETARAADIDDRF